MILKLAHDNQYEASGGGLGGALQGDVCFLKYQRRVVIIFMGESTFLFHLWTRALQLLFAPSRVSLSLFFFLNHRVHYAPTYFVT